MIKLPELNLSDESEMRAFYEQCSISKRTTEAAIRVRRNSPVPKEGNEKLRKRRPVGKFKDR